MYAKEGFGIGDVGVEAVAKAIRHMNCKVHTLKLFIDVHSDEVHSDMDEDEAEDEVEGPCGALAEALSDVNCKLRTLCLTVFEGDDDNDQRWAEEFVVNLTVALRSANCGLRSLNIVGDNISDSGIEYLAMALQHANCKLRTLCLISDGGVQDGHTFLASALRNSNCKLHTLHYGVCPDELGGHDPATAMEQILEGSRFDIEIKRASLCIKRTHGR
ncbi:hypothetical protein CYMTET_44464 [Cymbomonas tetramitiformis]|uniref:Uncharacterized protein n=1 Tax=Cymbomonas tetramitiformis TaxID=36881 RepID=A0AAE0C058_9CHLO|nr:hypothetical protein CYMTET_44464 [Cymbomonas tetramitiformis]